MKRERERERNERCVMCEGWMKTEDLLEIRSEYRLK